MLEQNGITVIFGILMLILLSGFAWLAMDFRSFKTAAKNRAADSLEILKLRLQAYERLTIFSERVSLHNLAGKLATSQLSAAEMQQLINDTIKTEFEYNISQQVYVSRELWKAVTKLKDQNMYVVNNVAAALPAGATGTDLCRNLIEFSMQPNAELSPIVTDAIQYEAKELM